MARIPFVKPRFLKSRARLSLTQEQAKGIGRTIAILCEGELPFTRRKTVVKQHKLLSKARGACPPDAIRTLIKPQRAFAWKLMVGELESLMNVMTNAS
jgi:hypothetical protein